MHNKLQIDKSCEVNEPLIKTRKAVSVFSHFNHLSLVPVLRIVLKCSFALCGINNQTFIYLYFSLWRWLWPQNRISVARHSFYPHVGSVLGQDTEPQLAPNGCASTLLGRVPLLVGGCEWVSEQQKHCKALWIKALEKHIYQFFMLITQEAIKAL